MAHAEAEVGVVITRHPVGALGFIGAQENTAVDASRDRVAARRRRAVAVVRARLQAEDVPQHT